MKRFFILILAFAITISSFIWYKLKVIRWIPLSEHWYLTNNTEIGYIIYSEQKSDSGYINIDEIYIEKSSNVVFLKNRIANQTDYYYQKFNLDKYGVYNV